MVAQKKLKNGEKYLAMSIGELERMVITRKPGHAKAKLVLEMKRKRGDNLGTIKKPILNTKRSGAPCIGSTAQDDWWRIKGQ